ncbi:hypothetical protein EYC84_008471 [Monilinia fructicola]|uniref:Uncharacterized protein n=1 Tax=Monilinia fructicola TaxID=38448 RepID=A0A5M9JJP8_MONFR|nr:hypothetical protein EYC84_008471 [Monilinia fructicola]
MDLLNPGMVSPVYDSRKLSTKSIHWAYPKLTIHHTMKPSQSLPSKCSLWQKPTMAYLSHPPASQIRILTLHRTSQRIRPSTRPNDPTSPNLELSASSDFWPQPHPLSHHQFG